MTGTFHGIGCGPGDPELLTLKAQRLIKACPVIAYPCNGEGESLARRIAAGSLVAGQEELPIHLPMEPDRSAAQSAYDRAAEAISGRLAAGRDVGFLCEGDPFFYGSFMYLFARLGQSFSTSVVPGVTSLTACAAALGRPLAARSEVLKVLPATLAAARLSAELATAESAAIIKVGRHFEKVRAVLDALGLLEWAALVEGATWPEERCRPLCDLPPGTRPYFSTILVYRGGEGW